MWLERTNPWLEQTNALFQSLNTLEIQDLHSFQVGIFMYQFHHNLFPDDLLESNYFTMNNEVHNYNTRATNIRKGLVNTCLAYKLAQKTFASPGKKCFTSKTEDKKYFCMFGHMHWSISFDLIPYLRKLSVK